MRRVSCKENEPLDYVRTEPDNWISRGEDFSTSAARMQLHEEACFQPSRRHRDPKVLQKIYNQSNRYYGV
jgi:hypothetical protein